MDAASRAGSTVRLRPGNGGWTRRRARRGARARRPVTVQLRTAAAARPAARGGAGRRSGVELRDGDDVVAVATAEAPASWTPPRARSTLATARAAEAATPGHRPTRSRAASRAGRGARRRAAHLPRAGRTTAGSPRPGPRRPRRWPGGRRRTSPVTWAALDCVGGWSSDLEHRPLVLAQMSALGSGRRRRRARRTSWSGRPCASRAARPGPPARCTTATGTLVAQAEHLWIAIDPSVVRQLQDG